MGFRETTDFYRGLARIRGWREAVSRFWQNLLYHHLFRRLERFGLHVLPTHFYSPVPDTRDLRANEDRWFRRLSFPGIDTDVDRQLALLDAMAPHLAEPLPEQRSIAAKGMGEGFGAPEARVLHAMVRHVRPERIIEVGAGMSTWYFTQAAARNHDDDSHKTNLISIEPYPTRPLTSYLNNGVRGSIVELVPKFVQDVELAVFRQLEAGDILFIDSSHVVRPDSDVNWLLLEVIPHLAPGVLIHVHDVHFPYPTAPLDDPLYPIPLFRSEPALLYALLLGNDSLGIDLCLSQLHFDAPDAFEARVPEYNRAGWIPSSIWLRTR